MIRKVLFRTTRAVKQSSDCVTLRRETAYKERASRRYAVVAEQTFVLLTRGENRLVATLEQWCWKLVIGNDVIDETFGHMLFIVKSNHPLWYRAVILS